MRINGQPVVGTFTEILQKLSNIPSNFPDYIPQSQDPNKISASNEAYTLYTEGYNILYSYNNHDQKYYYNSAIDQYQYDEAIGKYKDSIELFLVAENYTWVEHINNALASIFRTRDPLELAMYVTKQERDLTHSVDVNNQAAELKARFALGAAYRELGDYSKSNEHYSKAYLLQQGPVDYEAVRVEQKEVGFSNQEKLGTDNIMQCVVVIIRDPESKKTMLAHIDKDTDPSSLIKNISKGFDSAIGLDVWVTGGRDRTPHPEAKDISDANIKKVVEALQKLDVNVKSADIGDKPSPLGIIFDPITGTLEHRVPGKIDKTRGIRLAYFDTNFGNNELYVAFDLTKNKDIKSPVLTDFQQESTILNFIEQIQEFKKWQDGISQLPKSSAWQVNQNIVPIDQASETIRQNNPDLVAKVLGEKLGQQINSLNLPIEQSILPNLRNYFFKRILDQYVPLSSLVQKINAEPGQLLDELKKEFIIDQALEFQSQSAIGPIDPTAEIIRQNDLELVAKILRERVKAKISQLGLLAEERVVLEYSINEKIKIQLSDPQHSLLSIHNEVTQTLEKRRITQKSDNERLGELGITEEELQTISDKNYDLALFLKYDSEDIQQFLQKSSLTINDLLQYIEKDPDLALLIITKKNLILHLIEQKILEPQNIFSYDAAEFKGLLDLYTPFLSFCHRSKRDLGSSCISEDAINTMIEEYFARFEPADFTRLNEIGITLKKLQDLYEINPVLAKQIIKFSHNLDELQRLGISDKKLLELFSKDPETIMHLLGHADKIPALLEANFKIENLLKIFKQNPELAKLIFDKGADIINAIKDSSLNPKSILLARTEEINELLNNKISAGELKIILNNRESQSNLADLLKQSKKIKLQLDQTKKVNHQTQKEELYNPLNDNSLTLEEKINLRLYSEISVAVAWKLFPKKQRELKVKKAAKLHENINNILNQAPSDQSPREQNLFKKYNAQAAKVANSKESLLKEISKRDSKEKQDVIIYDNGKSFITVLKANDHYKIYSPQLNLKLHETKSGASLEEVEKFVKTFFQWKDKDASYKTYTLSTRLGPNKKLVQEIKKNINSPEKFENDYQQLLKKGGQIEGLSFKTIYELFAVDGKVININKLEEQFFENHHKITLKVDKLHDILPGLNKAEKKALYKVIKKYDLSTSWTSVYKADLDTDNMMQKYSDKIIGAIKGNKKIDSKTFSKFSYKAFEETLKEYPDITPELAKNAIDITKGLHDKVIKPITKTAITQGLFFMPDIIKNINSGQYQNIATTGAMVGGDAAANKLLGTIGKILPERVALLNKLPISSPIFKALTLYSIIELNEELRKLPTDDPQREIVKHELTGQYATAGIMVAEITGIELGFELGPEVWFILMGYQLITGAEDFATLHQLDLPFIDELAMSLGFEQKKLLRIEEERMLVQELLMAHEPLLNNIGWKIVQIPKIETIEWQTIDPKLIDEDIRLQLLQEAKKQPLNNPPILIPPFDMGAHSDLPINEQIAEGTEYKLTLIHNTAEDVDEDDNSPQEKWEVKYVILSAVNSGIQFGSGCHKYQGASWLEQSNCINTANQNMHKESNNWFLNHFTLESATWSRDPQGPASNSSSIVLNNLNHPIDRIANTGNAALYINEHVVKHYPDKLNNIHFAFDPRNGNIELDFPDLGFGSFDDTNNKYLESIGSGYRYNSSNTYILSVHVAENPLHPSMVYSNNTDTGTLHVNSNSKRLVGIYTIDNNFNSSSYFIKDNTDSTIAQFSNNQKYMGAAERYLINNSHKKSNSIKLTSEAGSLIGEIELNNDKKFLQINLGANLIKDNLNLKAEQLSILNVQGNTANHSTLNISPKVSTLNAELVGNIIVSDGKSRLTLTGIIDAGSVLKLLKQKDFHNAAVYTVEVDNIDLVLNSIERQIKDTTQQQRIKLSNDMELITSVVATSEIDLGWSIEGVECKWKNAISMNSTVKFIGKSDMQNDASLTINPQQEILVIQDQNGQRHSLIKNYKFNEIKINEDAYILRIFNHKNKFDDQLIVGKKIDTKNKNYNKLSPGIIIEFITKDGSSIYHNLLDHNGRIPINDIIYQTKNNKFYAIDGLNHQIDMDKILFIGPVGHHKSYKAKVYFSNSLKNSEIICNDTDITVDGITLLNVSSNSRCIFDNKVIPIQMLLPNCGDNNQINHSQSDQTYDTPNSHNRLKIAWKDRYDSSALAQKNKEISQSHQTKYENTVEESGYIISAASRYDSPINYFINAGIAWVMLNIGIDNKFHLNNLPNFVHQINDNDLKHVSNIYFQNEDNANDAIANQYLLQTHKGYLVLTKFHNSDGNGQNTDAIPIASFQGASFFKDDNGWTKQSLYQGCKNLPESAIKYQQYTIDMMKKSGVFIILSQEDNIGCINFHNIKHIENLPPSVLNCKNPTSLVELLNLSKLPNLKVNTIGHLGNHAGDIVSLVNAYSTIESVLMNVVPNSNEHQITILLDKLLFTVLATAAASFVQLPSMPYLLLIPSAKHYFELLKHYLPKELPNQDAIAVIGTSIAIAATNYSPELKLMLLAHTIYKQIADTISISEVAFVNKMSAWALATGVIVGTSNLDIKALIDSGSIKMSEGLNTLNGASSFWSIFNIAKHGIQKFTQFLTSNSEVEEEFFDALQIPNNAHDEEEFFDAIVCYKTSGMNILGDHCCT